jgi:hypothetical protein
LSVRWPAHKKFKQKSAFAPRLLRDITPDIHLTTRSLGQVRGRCLITTTPVFHPVKDEKFWSFETAA